MARDKYTEAEVAVPVVAHLESKGLDVYQEVPCSTGVADIVVLAPDGDDWIVEVKASWSLDLLEQAIARRMNAHRVAVAVPDGRGWDERADLFRSLGIGTYRVRMPLWNQRLECGAYGGKAPRDGCPCWICDRAREPPDVRLIGGPAQRQQPPHPIRELVRPEHKTHAKAGTRSGHGVFHWSPWRQTMQNLSQLVASRPDGITAAEASRTIEHHYPTQKNARASLAHWVERGKSTGVVSVSLKGRIWFFPSSSSAQIESAMRAAGCGKEYIARVLDIARLDAMVRKSERDSLAEVAQR